MKISIHQPCYIPYLGIFYKMFLSDQFVFLDDAQFTTGYVINWNTVKGANGSHRLKIPIQYRFGDRINQVVPRDEFGWKEKHLRSLRMDYSRAKYFDAVYPEIEDIILMQHENLAVLNQMLMVHVADSFGINAIVHKSSDMNIFTKSEERVINICNLLNADVYISGNGARAYQSEEHFNDRGINLVYSDYQPFSYKQLWNDTVKNLSVLDFVFNHGFDWQMVLDLMKG